MADWITLLVIIEMISSIKISEKYNQHLTFIAAVVAFMIAMEGIMGFLHENPAKLHDYIEDYLQNEGLSRWSYEVNEEMKEKLAKIDEETKSYYTRENKNLYENKICDELIKNGYENVSVKMEMGEEKNVILVLYGDKNYDQRNMENIIYDVIKLNNNYNENEDQEWDKSYELNMEQQWRTKIKGDFRIEFYFKQM